MQTFLPHADCRASAAVLDERVHESHRSRLIQKDTERYRPPLPGTPEDLECFWPVRRSASA